MNRILIPVAIVAVVVLWALSAVVVVREDQQAVIRSFNAIQRAETDAGLSFKLLAPLGSVDYIEKRVLATDPEIEQFILSDDTRLDVDYYVRYRITDPVTYVRNTNDLLSVLSSGFGRGAGGADTNGADVPTLGSSPSPRDVSGRHTQRRASSTTGYSSYLAW